MTYVNLAEKASAMNWGWVGSWKLLDVNRMKLSRGLVMSQESKQEHQLGVEIGSNSGIRCPSLGADFGNINVRGDQLEECLGKISIIRTRKRNREQTCCCWLPANRPMEAGPKDAREGEVPSSCQVIVAC